jgi:hypothetical protein
MKTKEIKRIEAEERHEYYNSLTMEQKIHLISRRPGNSAWEYNKLSKLLKKEK